MPIINPPLNISEEDGDPSVFPYKVKYPDGSITDNGDGTASVGSLTTETDPVFTSWNVPDAAYLTPGTAAATYEPLLPDTPTNPETKYLNGNKEWARIRHDQLRDWNEDPDYQHIDGTDRANIDDLVEKSPFWENINSPGRLWGGTITDNGDGTVKVAAGGGLIKEDEATLMDFPASVSSGQGSKLTYVEWDEVPSLPIPSDQYSFITYEGDTSSIVVLTSFDAVSATRDFTLGRAYRVDSNIVLRLCGENLWNFDRRLQSFGEEVFPRVRATGMVTSETGTRNIAVTAGVIWAELVNRFTTNAVDTSMGGTFTYWYRNGSGGWTAVTGQTQISNTWWDNNSGTPATLTVNRYGDHWVYVAHDSSVHVVLGWGNYTLSQAQTASPPSSIPGLLSSFATLSARIVIQRDAAVFTEVDSAFDTVFPTSVPVNHNDLSGIQGGSVGQYYHLSAAEYGIAQNTTGTNTGDQLTFKTVSVSGQDDVVATTTADTLSLIAGTNVTLTTDATGKSVTINSTGGGGGGDTGVTTLNTLEGDLSIVGTSNRVSVTASGTSITLTTPQDTHTNARPTFGAMTLATGTVTANTPILSGSQTWQNSAVSFRGIDINITNTSSTASSRPFSFAVGANAFYMLRFGGLVHSLTQEDGSSLIGYSQVSTWNASYTMNAVNVAITDTLSGLSSSLFRGVVNGTEVFAVRKSGRIISPFYQFLGGTVSVFNAAADNNQGALGGAFTFNNASFTFHGLLLNLTNTASGANSSLIYVLENGSERFRQYANGRLYVTTATLTASPGTTPIMRFASTVNNSGYTYHSFDISSTHTASQAGSTLFRVTDGTDAKLTVNKFGSVICNSSALATNATDGFVYIPTTPGTPTGVPRAYTGRVAMHYDASNNRLWIYNGAWRSVALA